MNKEYVEELQLVEVSPSKTHQDKLDDLIKRADVILQRIQEHKIGFKLVKELIK